MKKSKLTLRCLCEAAIMIALAQILGYLKLYELPQGGSITLSMLPIFLFCSRWGFGPGMLASFAFSLLQLFLDGAYAWSWQSMLGDYIFAFTVLGFAGLFSKKRFGFFYGTLLGSALRFLVHYVVGATVWGEYMPETFFGMTMTSPWFYSALYNGSYMVLDCALVLLVGWILWKPMGKYIRGGKVANAVLALLCALLLAGGAFGYVTLDGKLQEKQAEIDRLQEKTAFFDQNAVCVNDDGSMLYHRYGCARLEPDQCRIYSRKTAEAGGYEPCPDCFGS